MIDRYDMYGSEEPDDVERKIEQVEKILNANEKPAKITQQEYNRLRLELADCKKKIRIMTSDYERLKSYVNKLAKLVAEQSNARFY